jgi:hypothetical protein
LKQHATRRPLEALDGDLQPLRREQVVVAELR